MVATVSFPSLLVLPLSLLNQCIVVFTVRVCDNLARIGCPQVHVLLGMCFHDPVNGLLLLTRLCPSHCPFRETIGFIYSMQNLGFCAVELAVLIGLIGTVGLV